MTIFLIYVAVNLTINKEGELEIVVELEVNNIKFDGNKESEKPAISNGENTIYEILICD